MSKVDLSYHSTVFNGTLDYPSPYRGRPSPEIDAEWNKLINSLFPNLLHAHTPQI